MGRWMGEWMVGQVGKWMDGWMDAWRDVWMSGWVDGWVSSHKIFFPLVTYRKILKCHQASVQPSLSSQCRYQCL